MKVDADKTPRIERASEAGEAPDLVSGLLPCPFCGGAAEKRLTDGPERGFIGCFVCMIGLPFNVPYGEREITAWNARNYTELELNDGLDK